MIQYLEGIRSIFRKQLICFLYVPSTLTSLDVGDFDTVWTWGDKRPLPPGTKSFSEIFYRSRIKVTKNNLNKDS